jgi:hypothetical protein
LFPRHAILHTQPAFAEIQAANGETQLAITGTQPALEEQGTGRIISKKAKRQKIKDGKQKDETALLPVFLYRSCIHFRKIVYICIAKHW